MCSPVLASLVQVAYLDRILQLVAVARNRLQLVAMCCLVIAAKYEEAEENVPSISALNDLAPMTYTPEMAHQTEVLVLERLGWTLTVVTPVHYIGLYVRSVCSIYNDEHVHDVVRVRRSEHVGTAPPCGIAAAKSHPSS